MEITGQDIVALSKGPGFVCLDAMVPKMGDRRWPHILAKRGLADLVLWTRKNT